MGKDMKRNDYYKQHVLEYIDNLDLAWLADKSVLITGVTGMLGSALADMLLLANQKYGLNMRVVGVGRHREKAERLLDYDWYKADSFVFVEQDIVQPLDREIRGIDYIVHAASNAYPAVFKKYPVETMLANIFGTKNLLELAKQEKSRLLFVSSGEVYGECDCDVKSENDYGYVNSMEPRSCYPNSKRAAETLCVSYAEEYGVDTVAVRPSHVYGPTFTDTDNRVVTEFIREAMQGHDLILQSAGTMVRSYTYVLDACSGILKVLKKGRTGEAYNIADEDKIVSIAELAGLIAKIGSVNAVFDVRSDAYAGQTAISRQVMSGKKVKALGWICKYNVEEGLRETFGCIDVGSP